jgi:hypothetical protein
MATTTFGSLAASNPTYQAYQILHVGYIALPVIAGLDKFAYLLANWTMYLAPIVPRVTGISPESFMVLVGVLEVCAGVLVAIKPRYGAYVVAAWLTGIIVNLLMVPGHYDIALRDFALAMGALALARLSPAYDRAA